eukprot:SAG22_NODE_21759_length_254_cov_0.703226_1_plen_22_part_01
MFVLPVSALLWMGEFVRLTDWR